MTQFLRRYKQRKHREQIAPGIFFAAPILFRIFPADSGAPPDPADEGRLWRESPIRFSCRVSSREPLFIPGRISPDQNSNDMPRAAARLFLYPPTLPCLPRNLSAHE